MFKNFLKIAGRHLWQTRLYACINVIGLAIGSVCMVLATLYVYDEHSFDQFHRHHPNLYRITTQFEEQGKLTTTGGTGQVQGPAFKAQIPEILSYVRLMGGDIHGDVHYGTHALNLRMLFTDDNFFDIFSFKLLHGDGRTALKNVNSVVITEKTALKFFNRTDVIGQLLQMDSDPSAIRIGKPLVITAVVENPPAHSSIQFDILFPFRFLQVSFEDTSWLNGYLGTFLILHPRANLQAVIAKFNQIHRINAQEQLATALKQQVSAPNISYGLQRITDIHLNPQDIFDQNREAGIINGSKPIYSYIFLGIAVFVMLMASINFINISIANSMKRAREVGIRKTTGSSQAQILLQFLGEPLFLNVVALLLALVAVIAVLPVFNQLSGKQLVAADLANPGLLSWLAAILLFNVFVSGLYPAYLLSKLNPVQVLYQRMRLTGLSGFGRGLVVFQFTIALLLGIATLVFYEQMHFIRNKDLGYNPEQIVRIGLSGVRDTQRIADHFRNVLKTQPEMDSLSLTGDLGLREAKANDRKIKSYFRSVDASYLDLMEIKLKAGRNFSSQYSSDKKYSALVNEAFVKAAALTSPIGAQVSGDSYFGDQAFTIVGVVKNFHYNSLREQIQPMVMVMSDQYGGGELWVKTDQRKARESVAFLERTYKKLLPTAYFDYYFLDEQNALNYQQELRLQRMVTIVTSLSVFICCIGLFGLAHLSATQRTRETGIRIVLGATVSDILVLFSRDFFRIIALSIVIVCPIGYYAMHAWLEGFAYRIHVPFTAFIWSSALAVCIAMLTVCSQAFKAAQADPVRSLRSE